MHMTNNVSYNHFLNLNRAMRVLTDKDKRTAYETARAKYLFNLAQGIEELVEEKDEPSRDGEKEVFWTTGKVILWFSFFVFMPVWLGCIAVAF